MWKEAHEEGAKDTLKSKSLNYISFYSIRMLQTKIFELIGVVIINIYFYKIKI